MDISNDRKWLTQKSPEHSNGDFLENKRIAIQFINCTLCLNIDMQLFFRRIIPTKLLNMLMFYVLIEVSVFCTRVKI